MAYETVRETTKLDSVVTHWVDMCEKGSEPVEDVLQFFSNNLDVLNSADVYEEVYGAVARSKYYKDFYHSYC
jgi:hypothetical protein